MNDKIKQLTLLNKDENDPFIQYALAKEYEKAGDLEKSENLFEKLVTNHPNYVGTYYHYGGVLEKRDKLSKARQIYSTGLKVAQKVNDQLAYRELFAAISKFEE